MQTADYAALPPEAFRAEVRAWLDANFPKVLVGQDPQAGETDTKGSAADDWKTALCGMGWGTPTWPVEYGGGGLSPGQARVLREEIRKAGGWNPIGWGMGVRMLGPTLLEFGTEAQKREHIPRITRGETRWCQGYSEPGAGSDLASLQTRCEDMGDHFLVNGQKIWTSGAQYADWCFCLVRTDTSKKHEGISFVMIDMHQPGVDPRPIRLINDTSPFCETFFTDAVTAKENLVGPLNGGWTIAKRLLQHEREGISGAGAGGAGPGALPGPGLAELAPQYVGRDEDGRLADADLRTRLTKHLMEAQAFALTGRRVLQETKSNQGPSAGSSVLKNVGAEVRKERAELAVEILGHQGLGWGGEGFQADEVATIKAMLRTKSGSIAGGSHEVQNGIIAKRILGLPDVIQKAH